MPALVFCSRRWFVSSDEFVYLPLFDALIRATFLLGLCVVYLTPDVFYNTATPHAVPCASNLSDNRMVVLQACVGCFIGLYGVSFLVDLALAKASAVGSILETQRREPWVRRLLGLRLAVAIFLEFGVAVFASIFVFRTYTRLDCTTLTMRPLQGACVMSYLVSIAATFGVVLSFDINGRKHHAVATTGPDHVDSPCYLDEWESRCAKYFCCVRRGRRLSHHQSFSDTASTLDGDYIPSLRDAFSGIAVVFTDLLRHVDLVSSDVGAAMILLRKEQKAKRRAEGLPRSLAEFALLPTHTHELTDLAHYIKYACGAYGWPVAVFEHPFTCLCKLCCKPRPDGTTSRGDNCCGCNLRSVEYWVHHSPRLDGGSGGDPFQNAHVAYYSRRNELFRVPFLVAVDHAKKAVVVALRGTLSLQDTITDMVAAPVPLQDPAFCRTPISASNRSATAVARKNKKKRTLPETAADADHTAPLPPGLPASDHLYVHEGMRHCARNAYSELMGVKEGEIADDYGGVLGPLMQRYAAAEGGPYQLVVTGHSLGAGVASVLACLLRPHFPTLRCYAFSPPGGLMSMELARFTEEFVVSVAVGNDVIPRLAERTLERLRDDVMRLLAKCPQPKYRVMLGATTCCTPMAAGAAPQQQRTAAPPPAAPPQEMSVVGGGGDSREQRLLGEAASKLETFRKSVAEDVREQRIAMYPPGRMWYYHKYHGAPRRGGCCPQDVYRPALVDPKVSTAEGGAGFDAIVASPMMMRDHLPAYVHNVLHHSAKLAVDGEFY